MTRKPVIYLLILLLITLMLWTLYSIVPIMYSAVHARFIAPFLSGGKRTEFPRPMDYTQSEIANKVERKLTKFCNKTTYIDYLIPKQSNDSLSIALERYNGRFGNKIYQIAALIGIATENKMAAVVHTPLKAFSKEHGKHVLQHSMPKKNLIKFKEHYSSKYDHRVRNLSKIYQGKNIIIRKYFQSYHYFERVEPVIRYVFTFNANVRHLTANFYTRIKLGIRENILTHTLIGIHVRRGDVADRWHKDFGYVNPDVSYYKKAMEYYRALLPTDLMFIVCSDNTEWAKTTFKGLDNNLIISEGNSPEVDMAILASCDHMIMSIGTFGWWAGYLAGGNVVYYSNNPRPGSKRARSYDVNDVMPKYWKGLP